MLREPLRRLATRRTMLTRCRVTVRKGDIGLTIIFKGVESKPGNDATCCQVRMIASTPLQESNQAAALALRADPAMTRILVWSCAAPGVPSTRAASGFCCNHGLLGLLSNLVLSYSKASKDRDRQPALAKSSIWLLQLPNL